MEGEGEGIPVACWLLAYLVGLHCAVWLERPFQVLHAVMAAEQRIITVSVQVEGEAWPLRVHVPVMPQWFIMLGQLKTLVDVKVEHVLEGAYGG